MRERRWRTFFNILLGSRSRLRGGPSGLIQCSTLGRSRGHGLRRSGLLRRRLSIGLDRISLMDGLLESLDRLAEPLTQLR
jgi:hypothetical protein